MKITHLSPCIFMLLLAACTPAQKEPLTLHTLFSEGMVLQRDSDVPVWGTFTAGGTVTVEASWGERVSGSADVNGSWKLMLSTPEAGGPHRLTIATRDSTIEIADVLSGEVWLASGQSNMQMPVKGWPPRDPIQNSDEEIANANYPGIRMITVPRTASITPASTFDGKWLSALPENVGDFSATAYFFARDLHQHLDVPIGIIHSSWGGTFAEAWTSPEKLATLGDFDDQLKTISDPAVIEETTAWFQNRPGQPVPTAPADWEAVDWGVDQAASVDFDDSAWEEITLPGRFDVYGSGALDGAFWLRKSFEIEEPQGPATLSPGAIDDRDMVFINGQLVGSTMESGKHQEPREYLIEDGILQAGTNVIAILGIDTGGPGEFNGTMSLTQSNGQTISLKGSWRQRLAGEAFNANLYVYPLSEDLNRRPSVVRIHQNSPTALFNGMISPLIPYGLRGAIWYQGESNVGRAAQYERLFPAMITDWRERWDADFPFYFVQIAPFGYNSPAHLSPALRDAQRRTLSLANTGMAVTLDIGNAVNIHPGNKQDVGRRLALWALAQDYGKEVVPSGPLFRSAESEEGAMIVSFDYVAEGLQAAAEGLAGFAVAGADGQFVQATATMSGDQLIVASPQVPSPTMVRYAWTHTSTATLFNSAGLPASSFTSENALP